MSLGLLYRVGLKSYFRNGQALFWGIGWVIIWAALYAFVFPKPSSTYPISTNVAIGEYTSFTILFGVSTLAISMIYYAVLSTFSLPYLVRFTKTSSSDVALSMLLSSFTFGLVIGLAAVASSVVFFSVSYGIFPLSSIPLLTVVMMITSLFYLLLGSVLGYVSMLLKALRLMRFIGFLPFMLVFIFVLGLQIFRSPGAYLMYVSPFNALFTAGGYALAGSSFTRYYDASSIVVFVSPLLWCLILAALFIVLVRLFRNSAVRGTYKLEEIFG